MALIKCRECGKEFSDKVSACPNCACPIEINHDKEKLTKDNNIKSEEMNKEKEDKKQKQSKFKNIVIIALVIIALFFIYNREVRNFVTEGLLIISLLSYIYSLLIRNNVISEKFELNEKRLKSVFYICISLALIAIILNFTYPKKIVEYDEYIDMGQVADKIISDNINEDKKTENEIKDTIRNVEKNENEIENKIIDNEKNTNEIGNTINDNEKSLNEIESIKKEIIFPKKGSKLANDFDKEYTSDNIRMYINVDNQKNVPKLKKYENTYITDGVYEYIEDLKELGYEIEITESETKEPYKGFHTYDTNFKVSKDDFYWTMYLNIQDEKYVEYEFGIDL